MDDELLRLTRENNIMLKQILSYLIMQQNPNVVFQQDMKELFINMFANKATNNYYG